MEDSLFYVLVLVVSVTVFATFSLAVYSLYDTRRDRSMRRQIKAIVEALFKLAAFRRSLEGFPSMPKATKRFQMCFLARHTGVSGMLDRFRAQDGWKTYFEEYRVRERFGAVLDEVKFCDDTYRDVDLLVSDAQVAAADTVFRAVDAYGDDLARVFRRLRAVQGPGLQESAAYAAYLRRAACHGLVEVGAKSMYDAYVRSYHGGKPEGLGEDHVFLVCAFDALHKYPDVPVLDLCGPAREALLNQECPYASVSAVRACLDVLSSLRYYIVSRDLLGHLLRAEAGNAASVAALRDIYGASEGDLGSKIRRYHDHAGGEKVVPTGGDLLQAQIYFVFDIPLASIRRILSYKVATPGDESL